MHAHTTISKDPLATLLCTAPGNDQFFLAVAAWWPEDGVAVSLIPQCVFIHFAEHMEKPFQWGPGAPFLPARPWTGAAVARIPSTLCSQEIAHNYKGE